MDDDHFRIIDPLAASIEMFYHTSFYRKLKESLLRINGLRGWDKY